MWKDSMSCGRAPVPDKGPTSPMNVPSLALSLHLACLLALPPIIIAQTTPAPQCSTPKLSVDSQPLSYKVGGSNNRKRFVEYLTKYVGQRFDPPISFEKNKS